MGDDLKILSEKIKQKALALGFDICGTAKARHLSEQELHFRAWLGKGMNDRMAYLERDPAGRFNPELVFSGVKSLIVAGISYYSEQGQVERDVPVLTRYAYGEDYHDVIIPKLRKLLSFIREKVPGAEGRAFSDTGFLHEKSWIVEAGLGWQGKHSIMINPQIGSYFFIGILMVNIELDYDDPFTRDRCGSCRLCIDSCPTAAINEDRTIDARKCISNLTIENRGPIPEEIVPKLGGRVYGCDRCQEVCPWNKGIKPHNHPEFRISEAVASMTRKDWESITEDRFKSLFGRTAVVRVKFPDFRRNIVDAFRSMGTSG
ncbi:MAG: tRNA epoxyqueuosine(34) reductase QueG [Bacteroidales bacterium]|nr:tRNA epoxyqueuosine(34) reductase QueG [Bacteroidales bacterium]